MDYFAQVIKVRILGIALKVDLSVLADSPRDILSAARAIKHRDTNLTGKKTYLRIMSDHC
jgi:hypothetical protein